MIRKARAGHFATKKDFYNLRTRDPETARERLRELRDGRFAWFETGCLAEGVGGQDDDDHRVIEAGGETGAESGRIQLERREDPNSEFFRLGFTLAEAETFLTGGA